MFSNSIKKNKAGRPVTIDKNSITKKCLEFYLLNGIDNQSFNNVIKYAGVSKVLYTGCMEVKMRFKKLS